MKILIIGKNESAKLFANYFANNEENIVFATMENTDANFVDTKYNDVYELKDFALANQIDLSLLVDFSLIESDFARVFTDCGLTIFAPDPESAKITTSRVFGKRFMYKNKIKTAKFGIFDKPQMAIDYARNSQFPLIINADSALELFPVTFCTSFPKAKTAIENLFEMNAKQVVIENDICGTTFSLYIISDGYNAFELDYITTYKNKIAYLGANFLSAQMREEIMKRIVEQTILSLSRSKKHYVGVMGFDFVMDFNGKIYLKEYRPFFDDLAASLFVASYQNDDGTLFTEAITGSLLDNIENVKQVDLNFVSVKNKKGEIITEYARTLNEAKQKAYDETNDKDIFKII